MKQYHLIQINILQLLMYSDGLRYSQMKIKDMEGSQFTFHLDQLIKEDLVEKNGNKYFLTSKGKELAGRMDMGDLSIKEQAKISVFLCCIRETNGKTEYLLYTRKKAPFYGYQGFPTGKVKKGEDIIDAAKRELKEETNLEGNPEIFSIKHYKIYSKEKDLLEDKIYFIFKILNPKGELISNNEGEFEWVKKENVWDFLKKPVKEIEKIFEIIDSKEILFSEDSYISEDF